jgi:hypothetical protein
MATVVLIRFASFLWGLHLPVFVHPDLHERRDEGTSHRGGG